MSEPFVLKVVLLWPYGLTVNFKGQDCDVDFMMSLLDDVINVVTQTD